jgi:hypothetical protein
MSGGVRGAAGAPSKRPHTVLLFSLPLLSFLVFVLLLYRGNVRGYFAAGCASFACFGVSAWFRARGSCRRPAPRTAGRGGIGPVFARGPDRPRGTGPVSFSREWIFVLAAAAVMRLSLFGVRPETLSEDVYRYLWDGKAVVNGINPYRFPPAHDVFEGLKADPLYDMVEMKAYKTSYPPLSELIFALAYLVGGGSLFPLRAIYLAFDALCAFLLARSLSDDRALPIYALSPLVAVETYAGMHVDIIGAFFLLAAVVSFGKGRPRAAAALLVGAVLTKYSAVAAVPVFAVEHFRRERGRMAAAARSTLLLFLFGFGLAAVFFLPFAGARGDLFSQLLTYNRYWVFNGLPFRLLGLAAGGGAQLLRLAATLTLVCTLAAARRVPFEERVKLSILSLLLLSPAFFPWYLLSIVPLSALRPRASDHVILSLPFLSYHVLLEYLTAGVWREAAVVSWIVHVPYFALFILELAGGAHVRKQESCGDNPRAQRGGVPPGRSKGHP